MILIVALLVVVFFTLMWLGRPKSRDFQDLHRRERAMKVLGKHYNPESDTALQAEE